MVLNSPVRKYVMVVSVVGISDVILFVVVVVAAAAVSVEVVL